MYQLKESINHTAFLQQIQRCQGGVFFLTTEGDRLDLKSALSQLLFAAAFLNPKIAQNATIQCENPADHLLLEEYLRKAEG